MLSLARHKCIAISQDQRADEMISLRRLEFVPGQSSRGQTKRSRKKTRSNNSKAYDINSLYEFRNPVRKDNNDTLAHKAHKVPHSKSSKVPSCKKQRNSSINPPPTFGFVSTPE